MAIWWSSLSVIMKILWGVTLAATLIFIIQSIMTFVGADVDADTDFDAASDGIDSGMNLYTFRNFVNFLLGFGWTAILMKDSIQSKVLLVVVSTLVGVALVAIVMYMFKLLASLQQNGAIDVNKDAVGCTGKVYIPIPGERKGEGKVQITINNAVREYVAMTDGDSIKTDTPVKVVEVLGDDILLVEEMNSLII